MVIVKTLAFNLRHFFSLTLAIATLGLGTVTAQSKKLGINSDALELKPMLSIDGQTLYFTRDGHAGNQGGKKAGQDIWMAKVKDTFTIENAVNLGSPINNNHNNAIAGISDDNKRILLLNQYTNTNDMKAGLATVEITDGKYGTPKDFPFKGLKAGSRSMDVSFTPDGNIMLVSMGNNDKTKEDLYVSLNRWGSWSDLIHMGNTVNTEGSEISPFLSADKNTLYYATDGNATGKGGYDIYMSKRLDDSWTNWSIPVNLGPEVNTEGFDAYFVTDKDEEVAFYVSDKDGNEDIYGIKVNDIFLLNDEPVSAASSDCSELVDIQEEFANEQIAVALQINWCDEQITSAEVNKTDNSTMTEEEKMAAKISGGGTQFGSLYFATGKSKLSSDSKKTLDKLAEELKNNQNATVRLAGFADPTGQSSDNIRLSINRAGEVMSYLADKGVDPSRVTVNAYGETKATNKDDVDRRVELYVVQ